MNDKIMNKIMNKVMNNIMIDRFMNRVSCEAEYIFWRALLPPLSILSAILYTKWLPFLIEY